MNEPGAGEVGPVAGRRTTCPYCAAADVARLYLASVQLDSCECPACGARWDEDPGTGSFRGRASRASVVVPRDAPTCSGPPPDQPD